MGREIRKVPANWQHPKKDNDYAPMHDETFEHAAQEWKNAFMDWEVGEKFKHPKGYRDNPLFNPNDPDNCSPIGEPVFMEYWEWDGNPPDPEYYRPYKDEEGVWFQVYETVSEGTPVTPPFATLEELSRYLYTHGCKWDDKPWTRENAEAFCHEGASVPSMVTCGGKILMSKDIPAFFEKRNREPQ